ncbi:MAG: retroviral-like aspartic protease family protein [Rubrivivax sp.]|nr:retroviral-like aspartic protease family protein [Rubrivivax sp.]
MKPRLKPRLKPRIEPVLRPLRGLPHRLMLAGAMAVALCAVPAFAQGSAGGAPEVALAGRMGDKALLLLQGRSVVLAVGQASGGTRLVRWEQDAAVVEHAGAQLRLRVGAAPSRLGAAAAAGSAREIVIPVGPGGHFLAAGAINGQSVRFLVDTGATLVALSRAEAARLRLDLRGAQPVRMQTAGGVAAAWMLPLERVRVGDVEVFQVMALVTEAPLPYVLLGNSFLDRFQWRRDNDVMRLSHR